MSKNEYPIFTEEMKKEYTILVPTMLPYHFEMMTNILKANGYNAILLKNIGGIKKNGLKYVHNDTCYPAQVVIGQLIDAVESGKFNVKKIALLITQTGGGCRASNYLSLLRKALKNAGYGFIPVISLNASGLEKSAFKVTLPMAKQMMYACLFGDLLMCLKNQTEPYEINKGEAIKTTEKWTKYLSNEFLNKKLNKENFKKIVEEFKNIKTIKSEKTKVGIVGEIFVKFSPLGNNNLEDFLHSQGTEVVMAGLLDFILYCTYNSVADYKLYNMNPLKGIGAKVLYNYLIKKQSEVNKIIRENSDYCDLGSFDVNTKIIKGYVGIGAKMGEGWLLTAEMLELINKGVNNVICTQPFGCLPNHIVGKGMIKQIKETHPNVNIVPIDYDFGTTKVNQENRIKLMLANANES